MCTNITKYFWHSKVLHELYKYVYIDIRLTVHSSHSPLVCILAAVFTVSPNKQYLGILFPTTPATTGPINMQYIFVRLVIRKCFHTLSNIQSTWFEQLLEVWERTTVAWNGFGIVDSFVSWLASIFIVMIVSWMIADVAIKIFKLKYSYFSWIFDTIRFVYACRPTIL